MKNWKENRALACVVLAAAILGGTFGIGGAKLSSAARSVNEAYAQNIAGDLALRAAAAHAPENIGARGDGLCPQRLGREGGGHLGGYHAGQPVGHGRFDERITAQCRDGRCAVGRDVVRHRYGRSGR